MSGALTGTLIGAMSLSGRFTSAVSPMVPIVGSSGGQPGDGADRQKAQLEQILNGDEFSYGKSLLGRFLAWLGRLIERLIPDGTPPTPNSTGGSGLVTTLVIVVLVVGALAMAYFAFRQLRRRGSRNQEEEVDEDSRLSVRPNSPREDFVDNLATIGETNDWKGEILRRYRHLVGELADRELVDAAPGDSPTDLYEDLKATLPGSVDLMGEANRIFADPWYGDLSTSQKEAERLEEITTAILVQERNPGSSSARGGGQ